MEGMVDVGWARSAVLVQMSTGVQIYIQEVNMKQTENYQQIIKS